MDKKSLKMILITIAAVIPSLVLGCGDSEKIKSYPLTKVHSQKSHGHEWLACNPTIYRVTKKSVIAKTLTFPVNEYKDCLILDKENWECRFNDSSGRFGMNNGLKWDQPAQKGIKYLNCIEYNYLRWQWMCTSYGKFWGTLNIIADWE